MSEIYLIGTDGSGISAQKQKLLEQCSLIVCSGRLQALLPDLSAEISAITPLQDAFDNIENGLTRGKVAVLASGDPLFFGIGSKIFERFGEGMVKVYPALSSLQEAFARFKMPWSEAKVVSLHGRKKGNLPGLLLSQPKTFAFTDSRNSPDMIARILLDYLEGIGAVNIVNDTLMHVAENLGGEDERIARGRLDEIAAMCFDALNVLCLTVDNLPRRPVFGLNESEIVHSRGLITKDEVRAATLHRLRLPHEGVFWDIGGGSGSLSIEAAAMHPGLEVYTVERKQEEIANIKENIRRFGLFNIVPLFGKAAELVDSLPDPDAVFVGGSGGELETIIAVAAERLTAGGRLVVNGVTEKTISQAPQLMQRHDMKVEWSRIEVNREGQDGPVKFNPITIMVGRK